MADELLIGFIKWLKKWFMDQEIASMIYGRWRARDGVPMYSGVLSAGEFLQLIVDYVRDLRLKRGTLDLEVLDGPLSAHLVELNTRTLLIDLHIDSDALVDEKLVAKLLRDAIRQVEEAEPLMAVRTLIV